MPAPIDPKLKAQVKRAYVNSKMTPADLAKQFGVSDRSIQNWAKNEHWDAERTAQNVIDLETARVPRERPPSRVRAGADDALSIADTVISDLQGELVRGDVTAKDKAAVANSLKAWVEFRRKLKPPTVADLVELAIELGITPDEFLTSLRDAWTKRA